MTVRDPNPALCLPLNAGTSSSCQHLEEDLLSLVLRQLRGGGLRAQVCADSCEATAPEQGGAWACWPGEGALSWPDPSWEGQ